MQANPRKISEIIVNFKVNNGDKLSDVQKQKLINAAHTCPVALSLAQDIIQTVNFEW